MQVFVKNMRGICHKKNIIENIKFSRIIPTFKNYMTMINQNNSIYRNYNKNFTNKISPLGCSLSNVEAIEKIFKLENKDYFVHQFNVSCLAQYSYYIESEGEALIIDPVRETDMYVEMLKKRGAKLKYILETHFHADFVSGHLELANTTGAEIVFGPKAKTDLKVKVAKDGELLKLGKVNIKVFHTPGHTLESSSYVLLDTENQPKAMFTGDFLFLGEVGRPDLAVGNGMTEKDLAGLLHNSIMRLKKEYPGEMVIFPGHGAGSACGKKISSGVCDTLRNQIKTNYALSDNLTREEFIEIVTSNLPTPPQYFFYNAMLNMKGYDNIETTLKKTLIPLKPNQFVLTLKSDNNIAILDTREFPVSRKSFVKGSYLISLSMQYAIWVAQLFKPDQKFLLITEPGRERESVIRLARVGYENILGFLDGTVQDLSKDLELVSLNAISPDDVKSVVDENNKSRKFEVVDVREINEWQDTGVLPNAHLSALSELPKNSDNLIKELNNKSVGVYCKSGGRATIAASILRGKGIKDVFVLGGYLNMAEKDVKFTPLH